MKNRGSTPILTNLVGVHPRNNYSKFEAKKKKREFEKLKKFTPTTTTTTATTTDTW